MSENLMNSAHKATNEKYREGWDRIFKKPLDEKLLKEAQRVYNDILSGCLKNDNDNR